MVRSTKTKGNLRILDRQDDSPITENREIKTINGESAIQKEEEKIVVNIGIDVSTSICGVCVLENNTGKLVSLFSIKLTSSKLEDIWDKALEFQKEFQKAISPRWIINRVFVEDVAKMFSPGFSSAGTLITLAKMNAIVCLTVYNTLHVKPIYVNVRSARAKLGIKIDTKDKSRSTKEKVLEQVIALQPTFPWIQHLAKSGKNIGNMVYDTCNGDMADSYVAVRGGMLLNTQPPTIPVK